jgi:hypothetical protein
MPRGRAWRRAWASTRMKPLICLFAPGSLDRRARAPSMVEERTDGVLRPDAAIFEVIGKPCGRIPSRSFKIALRPETQRNIVVR